ncbi:alpha/beta hydrolase [bacterium]|nr:alpha/beta hydrolase [bacterium]
MDINLHSFWHITRLIVLAGLIFYLGLSTFLFMIQSRLVFQPVRDIERTPGSDGLAYEDVTFGSKDGILLTGWFVPAEQERGVVIFCHGNGGNISHRIESIRIFHDLGLSTFIFDYRGYGMSGGKPGERGIYDDAEAAWHYLTENRHISPERIIFFGRSLGGAAASWLAREHTPRLVIIESSFTSIPDLGANLHPLMPVRLLARFSFPTVRYLSEVRCPVLVIHSSEDDLIPFSHGQALFDAAHEPKEFLEIHGTHNDGFLVSGQIYIDGLQGFISRYLAP